MVGEGHDATSGGGVAVHSGLVLVNTGRCFGYRSGVELHGDLVARRDQAPLRRFRGLGVSMLL